jgi:hypothetical protein
VSGVTSANSFHIRYALRVLYKYIDECLPADPERLSVDIRGRFLDCSAYALIGSATTDVATHCGIDLGVGRFIVGLQ